MSLDRALGVIDSLLEILDEADKRQSDTTTTAPSSTSTKPTTAAESTPAKPFEYIQSLDDVEESQLVQLTSDLASLKEKWKQAGLVENDELNEFCNQIGKVVEIESSDDTLQIQWANYDTCWVPAFACGRAPSGAKLTIPGTNNSWLNEEQAVGKEFDEEKQTSNENTNEEERYLANVEDEGVIIGNTLRVTNDLKLLQSRWKTADLDAEEKLDKYVSAVGTILEVSEDHDTVKLQWKNDKSTWIPVQACLDAHGADVTSPTD